MKKFAILPLAMALAACSSDNAIESVQTQEIRFSDQLLGEALEERGLCTSTAWSESKSGGQTVVEFRCEFKDASVHYAAEKERAANRIEQRFDGDLMHVELNVLAPRVALEQLHARIERNRALLEDPSQGSARAVAQAPRQIELLERSIPEAEARLEAAMAEVDQEAVAALEADRDAALAALGDAYDVTTASEVFRWSVESGSDGPVVNYLEGGIEKVLASGETAYDTYSAGLGEGALRRSIGRQMDSLEDYQRAHNGLL